MRQKFLSLLFLLTLFTFSSFNAEAQIFKNQKKRAEERAKQRAKYKAQNKVDRKVDEAVDDTFNKIGDLFKKKKKEETNGGEDTDYNEEDGNDTERDYAGNFSNMIMGKKSASELGLPNSYEFDVFMKTKITSTNKIGKEESSIFNYLFPDDEGYLGYEFEDQVVGVMDMERRKIVSVIKEQQMATVMDLEAIEEMASDFQAENNAEEDIIDNNEEEFLEEMQITKTGKTKMIAGYNCDQYLIESEEVSGEMWKALDFDRMDMMKMSAGMAQMIKQNKKLKMPEEYVEFMQSGFLFEGTFYDKESKEKTNLVVLSVESKKTEVDLQKYQIMDMSNFMKKR